ncbi:MAG: lipoprotein signal peptidase [Steroidobacteraceae bacterium]|nr:lipoprotein signal peptidase [Steroidobacteraceae bacterium]
MNETVVAKKSALVWLWLSASVVVLDQLTKWIVVQQFALFEILPVAPFLELTRLHNEGAAFSLLAQAGGWQRWFFLALAGGITVLIGWWLSTLPARGHPWLTIGLALILGGAIGNGIDRARDGYVVDFLHFHWGGAYFPAFNVADIGITTGAIMLIIDAILHTRRVKERGA